MLSKNKCFSCGFLTEDSGAHTFECEASCMDCENSNVKQSEKPCSECGFNNQCLFKKKNV